MNKIFLNTGRSCLRYIVRAFQINEIYIPYYHCPSVRLALSKENCKVKFYHIDKNFKCVDNIPENAYILYPNYFGISSANINEMADKYTNLIVDNAHSLFSEPVGIASFYSLRKFFSNLRDGAFLYTNKLYNYNFEKDVYEYQLKYLSYEELCKNELRLDNENIKIISDCSVNHLKNINIENEKKKYIDNFAYWHNKLKSTNQLDININHTDVPFGYPYLAKTAIEAQNMVKELNTNGYNIFRYWNNLPDSFEEKIFYTNLVVICPLEF